MQLNTYLKLKVNDLRDSLTLAMWNWWSMQSHIGHACGTAKHTVKDVSNSLSNIHECKSTIDII